MHHQGAISGVVARIDRWGIDSGQGSAWVGLAGETFEAAEIGLKQRVCNDGASRQRAGCGVELVLQ